MSFVYGIMNFFNIKGYMFDGKKMKSNVDYRVGNVDEVVVGCIIILKNILF